MDLTSASPVQAQLAIVGLRVEKQTQAAMAQLVGQALTNAKEIQAQAASSGGDAKVDVKV